MPGTDQPDLSTAALQMRLQCFHRFRSQPLLRRQTWLPDQLRQGSRSDSAAGACPAVPEDARLVRCASPATAAATSV